MAIEHSHDIEKHGMPIRHAWLKASLQKAAAAEGEAPSWKIAEMVRDPIWPPPTAFDAAPEYTRLGNGRTLGACSDIASLTAVALTAWVAGDRDRFELTVAPNVQLIFKALGIEAAGVAASWEGRAKLLAIGNLISVNSPMVDTDAGGHSSVLTHAHLFDASAESCSGRPTAHFALRLEFTGAGTDLTVSSVIGDVIWMDEEKLGVEYETEGLSFDNPPVQSIYTRALTFLKAWETESKESLAALVAENIRLVVERYKVDKTGREALLEYRASLEVLGMITVDSVRVSRTKFEAYLHEYGVEANQHGLPRMHGGLVLEFSKEEATKEMKVSSMVLDVEWAPMQRRSSTFAALNTEVTLSGGI